MRRAETTEAADLSSAASTVVTESLGHDLSSLPCSGGCLKLWARRDMKRALFDVYQGKTSPYRRNAPRSLAQERQSSLGALASPAEDLRANAAGCPMGAGEVRAASAGGRGLLMAPGDTPRDAWCHWVAPHFTANDSAYLTGTYSDEYGYCNGLMLVRNVHKDFRNYLLSVGFTGKYIVGVEQHQYRDILHLHAILEGPYNEQQRELLKAWWSVERGHARVLPVLDGGVSYITKYALKGDTDAFEWRLS